MLCVMIYLDGIKQPSISDATAESHSHHRAILTMEDYTLTPWAEIKLLSLKSLLPDILAWPPLVCK